MNKEDFEKGYCERAGISVSDYQDKYELVTLPCKCGEIGCEGWAAVSNSPLSIENHKRLYS
jgi:hypothetical protein